MAQKTDTSDEIQKLRIAIREKKTQNFYIFHGEEAFLLHHYLGQLKKLLIDPLTESFNYNKLTKETFDLRSFADSVESLPMMAEHTFVWVDDIDIFKLPESDREKLAEVFSDIPDYCTIVFTFETVEWKPDKRLKKFWDSISKNATIVEFAKQNHRDLIAWVTRHFAANRKRITPDLCSYLIDITGGTMTALAGEISKICAYSGADTITKSDIDAVVEPVLDAVVFQMTDLMGEGNYGAALVKLRQLLQMQNEPLSILGAIGLHFRRIGTARTLLENGKTAETLMKLCGMGDYPARKTMAATKRFSARFCAKAAELILETDHNIKTSYDDPERLLEQLLLQLAGEARNG
ncbi:MAG: DNA polymerase III subunit delta [Oscillospiraceae bacterium]|nr:DNA polymerase III subunit delta [Oscillospiraceae bacterium]